MCLMQLCSGLGDFLNVSVISRHTAVKMAKGHD